MAQRATSLGPKPSLFYLFLFCFFLFYFFVFFFVFFFFFFVSLSLLLLEKNLFSPLKRAGEPEQFRVWKRSCES